MNKDRRKQIDDAIGELEHLKSVFENIRDEEQEYFDSMPGNIQSGEKGENSQSCIDSLEAVITSLEEALGDADAAKG